jgi:hypothetical protein
MPRSMFQRRHYQAVADILSTANAQATQDLFAVGLLHSLRDSFADTFEHDNDRFDRARFETACAKK